MEIYPLPVVQTIGRVFLAKATRPGQKYWQPILGIEFPRNQ
jgi:hypothetical protein